MPTLTTLHCAITIDVLMRVSLVLAAGLLLALRARKNAALRHAILVAGLAASFIVPVTMVTVEVLPVSRLQLDWLSSFSLGDPAVVAEVRSRATYEPHQSPARVDHAAPAIVPASGPQAKASAQWDERYVQPRTMNWLKTLHGRFMTSALLWALMCGTVVKLTGLGFSLLRLRRIVARARPLTSARVLSMLGLLQGRIPARHTPRLLESAEVPVPVAVGVIGDYVLLPTGWAGSLCEHEMLAILSHESAHLARRDHIVVFLQELLASALWFHPLVYLFNRMLNRVREEVCDNHAITLVERPAYCEALLHISVVGPKTCVRGATSMWTRHWPLEDRIRGILDEQRPTKTKISWFARASTAAVAAALCGLIALPRLTASPPNDRIAMAADADSPPRATVGPVTNEITRSIVRSFPVNGEKMLRFENLAGRVELVPGNGPRVEVEAIVRVSDVPKEEAKRLIDDIRWVEVPAEDGGSRWGLSFPAEDYSTVRYPVSGEMKTDSDTVRYLGREVRISNRRGDSTPSVEFDLRVSLPPGVRVAVDNAVGPIDGESVDSPLKLSTRHGVIKLGRVQAPVDATSMHGDVLISQLDADAVVHTGRGDIVLSRVTQGHVTLSTGSGHCRVVLPPESGFRLQYSGARPLELVGGGASRFSALSGGRRSEMLSRGTGGPSITVTSDTGDTVIEAGP